MEKRPGCRSAPNGASVPSNTATGVAVRGVAYRANYHRRDDTIGDDTMGMHGKRAGGTKVGGWSGVKKLKVDLGGVDVRRTMRGELVVVPAPLRSHLPSMLRLVPRPRGLFAAKKN